MARNAVRVGMGFVTCFMCFAATVDTEPSDVESLALRLTEAQAVVLALENNPKLAEAEEQVKAAAAQTGQAKAARLPQVQGDLSYNYVDGIEPMLDFRAADAIGFGAIQPEKEQTIARGTIKQVVFAGGQIRAAIEAANFLESAAGWQKKVAENDLAFQAAQAFHDAVLADALVGVAAESVHAFERHVTDAQFQYDAGYIGNFELLRARTELNAREAGLESARTASTVARLNLMRLLALPLDTPANLETADAWAPLPDPVQGYVADAIANRPEIEALDAGIDAARARRDARKGSYLPKAAISAQYQSVDGGGKLMPDGWSANAGITWEVYAGGRRKQEVLEAEANIRKLEHQREDLLRLVELDVRQAFARVNEALATIEKEQSAVGLAEEGLRLAELRFHEGAGIQTDVFDAELALAQARSALRKALRDYAVAAAGLKKAVGALPVEFSEP